jgi:hypothetical protein
LSSAVPSLIYLLSVTDYHHELEQNKGASYGKQGTHNPKYFPHFTHYESSYETNNFAYSF